MDKLTKMYITSGVCFSLYRNKTGRKLPVIIILEGISSGT